MSLPYYCPGHIFTWVLSFSSSPELGDRQESSWRWISQRRSWRAQHDGLCLQEVVWSRLGIVNTTDNDPRAPLWMTTLPVCQHSPFPSLVYQVPMPLCLFAPDAISIFSRCLSPKHTSQHPQPLCHPSDIGKKTQTKITTEVQTIQHNHHLMSIFFSLEFIDLRFI